MALVIPAEGEEKGVVILSGAKGFKQIQQHVGGFIVPVRLHDGGTVWVDEDGLPKRLPVNRTVTAMTGQLIVGTAVLCKKGEWNESG